MHSPLNLVWSDKPQLAVIPSEEFVNTGRIFPWPVGREASGFLPRLNEFYEIKLDQFAPSEKFGSLDKYALAPSGEWISQKEFAAAYHKAVITVSALADELLNCGHGQKELASLHHDIRKSRKSSPFVPDGRHWTRLQDAYEQSIRTEIVRLSRIDNKLDPELRARAINQALLATQLAGREARIKELLNRDGALRLKEYGQLMERARTEAGPNPAVTDVLFHYVRLVNTKYGYYPKLHVFSDFDGYLTKVPESGSPYKPGELTNRLLSEVDRAVAFPLHTRLALSEYPGLDEKRWTLANRLYDIAAKQSEFFFDAQVLFRQLAAAGASHTVLTGNHTRLIQAAVRKAGICENLEVLGMHEAHSYRSKADIILLHMLENPHFGIYLVGDDKDSALSQHIKDGAAGGLKDEVYGNAWLPDLVFIAARQARGPNAAENSAVANALAGLKRPFALNLISEKGKGLEETNRFVREYLNFKPRSWDEPTELVMRPTYKSGDLAADMRERVQPVNPPMVARILGQAEKRHAPPQAIYRTLITPNQDLDKVLSPEGNRQYDLGVPTAVFDKSRGKWLILYKSADGPSGFAQHSAISNVFAAAYDSKTGAIEFFDKTRQNASQDDIHPFIESALPERYSIDGLHDPRATIVKFHNGEKLTIVLACAFNKKEEQDSIKEAAGDLEKPIRGAVTEAFLAHDPFDPKSYQTLGLIGPDHHFKNMVVFPRTFMVNGKESLMLLTRKIPGIQCTPITLEQLKSFGKNDALRRNFWHNVLRPESVKGNTAISPLLLHEGYLNQNSPCGEGQLAPGVPPIHVKARENGKTNDYWLVIYNSVPDYKDNGAGSADGRLINAALLDYRDPRKLVARAPLPIIAPRADDNFIDSEGLVRKHENVAFTGGGGLDADGQLVVFYTENDTIVRSATWPRVDDVVDYVARYDAQGREKKNYPPVKRENMVWH